MNKHLYWISGMSVLGAINLFFAVVDNNWISGFVAGGCFHAAFAQFMYWKWENLVDMWRNSYENLFSAYTNILTQLSEDEK